MKRLIKRLLFVRSTCRILTAMALIGSFPITRDENWEIGILPLIAAVIFMSISCLISKTLAEKTTVKKAIRKHEFVKKARAMSLMAIAIATISLSTTGCSIDQKTINEAIEVIKDEIENANNEELKDVFEDEEENKNTGKITIDSLVIPKYQGEIAVIVNDNRPLFTEKEITNEPFEYYSPLDAFGRCGTAFACIGKELMSTEKRGEIGHIKPTGWHQNKYEGIVNSNPPYLYNRCHLIAFCLTGENANEKNLITGTRYFNVEGMLPFEEKVLYYLRENPERHVMYRVTPVFEEDNLLAKGVLIEALSVEDKGRSISFCVFVYNVQPGVKIDYTTGENEKE